MASNSASGQVVIELLILGILFATFVFFSKDLAKKSFDAQRKAQWSATRWGGN